MVFIANPLSGMATGPPWLPTLWGPSDSCCRSAPAGTLVRSTAFFDGNGSRTALLVLIIWVLIGLGRWGLSALRRSRPAKA